MISQIGFVSDFGKLKRLGNDLLSHALRRSTIGAVGFHGPVRDGMGCFTNAIITKSFKPTNIKIYTSKFIINDFQKPNFKCSGLTATRDMMNSSQSSN